MASTVFTNSTSKVPKSDAQVVRIDMTQSDIGGRKDGMPEGGKSDKMGIRHVPNVNI